MLIELSGASPAGAIALQSMVFNIGRVIGPIMASWLLTSTGTEGSVFMANGISYLFVIAGLVLVQHVTRRRTSWRHPKALAWNSAVRLYRRECTGRIHYPDVGAGGILWFSTHPARFPRWHLMC